MEGYYHRVLTGLYSVNIKGRKRILVTLIKRGLHISYGSSEIAKETFFQINFVFVFYFFVIPIRLYEA